MPTRPHTSLHELRTAGFHPLRPGRIHLRCPHCGRKQSNSRRGEHDHPAATLVQVACGACAMGGFPTPDYFDAHGNPVDWGPNDPDNA